MGGVKRKRNGSGREVEGKGYNSIKRADVAGFSDCEMVGWRSGELVKLTFNVGPQFAHAQIILGISNIQPVSKSEEKLNKLHKNKNSCHNRRNHVSH